jgi:hypothetical protein
MTIKDALREEYLKRSEEIHRIKTENPTNLPKTEHWARYKAAKDEASLILTAVRIARLFPDEIKELLTPFTFQPTGKQYSVYLERMIAQGTWEMRRRTLRNRILSGISKIKPHCHKKKARNMVKRALKYLRQEFRDKNLEELFYVKPLDFAPQA